MAVLTAGRSCAAALLAVLVGLGVAGPASAADEAHAADRTPPGLFDRRLLRFEFDNDTFLKSDDSYSAGWSLQIHSALDDTWGRAWAGWIGRLPGLGDDGGGGRIARWAAGFGQMIFTPREITFEQPQPDDSPWAGVLGASLSWSAYDNRRLGAMQLFLGCMGPCAGGEAVHLFVHDTLGIGENPEGWDNQLADQALANLNYQYRYKVLRREPAAHLPGRFTTDVAVGGEVGAGSLATFVQAQVEFRFGWGLPMGFASTPDPQGTGIMLDPVYFDRAGPLPDRAAWRTYFDLIGRGGWIGRMAPFDGGETLNGEHPGLDAYPGSLQALVGAHVARLPVAFHATWHHYFRQSETGLDGSNDWINLTFEYRF